MRDVFRADLGEFVLSVIGLVGQTDPGLGGVRQIAGGVLVVGVDEDGYRAAHAGALQPAEQRRESPLVAHVGDRGEFGGDRREPGGGHRGGVHEAGVQIADLAGVAARLGVGGRGILDDCLDVEFGLVVQRAEGAVHGAVGGYPVGGQPFAVDVREQVVLHPHALVQVGQIDSGRAGQLGSHDLQYADTRESRPPAAAGRGY